MLGDLFMTAPLIAGFLAGSVHVLAGPDHLAAVAPFALRQRWRAWISGIQWGVGHTVGVGLIALAAWWLRGLLPLERISGWSEQIVGVVLVAIGIWTIRAALRRRIHVHRHTHGSAPHVHPHIHGHGASSDHDHSHAPLWIGFLHGAAGSAHFVAILPALALGSSVEAASYLTGYAGGTVASMVAFTIVLGTLSVRLGGSSSRFYEGFLVTAGGMAVVVGAIWLIP